MYCLMSFFIPYRLAIQLIISIFLISFLLSCQSSIRFTTKTKTDSENVIKVNKDYSIPEKTSTIESSAPPNNLIQFALTKIGTPYCFGGISDNCYDCSGFVVNVYNSAGIYLPRTAEEQFYYSKRIDEIELKSGDLVFFRNKNRISHVGIYIGNNEIVHSSTSMGVIRQSLNDMYLRNRLVGYGRVLE